MQSDGTGGTTKGCAPHTRLVCRVCPLHVRVPLCCSQKQSVQ